MPELRIDKFNGGITDHIFDAPVNFAEAIENMTIDADGKLNQRPGLDWAVYEWDGSTETLNKTPFSAGNVTDVKVIDNPPSSGSVPSSISGRIIMVKAGRNLYMTYAWVDVDNSGVRKLRMLPFKRHEGPYYFAYPPALNDTFNESSDYIDKTYSKISAVQTPAGVFYCGNWEEGRQLDFTNTDPDYSSYTNVKKFYDPNYQNSVIAGLPRPVDNIFISTTHPGDTYQYTYYVIWRRQYTYGGKTFFDFGPPQTLQVGTSIPIEGGGASVGLNRWTLDSRWDYIGSKINYLIYRTEANGVTPYRLTVQSNTSGFYTDTTADEDLIGGEVFYGVSEEDNGEPPTARDTTTDSCTQSQETPTQCQGVSSLTLTIQSQGFLKGTFTQSSLPPQVLGVLKESQTRQGEDSPSKEGSTSQKDVKVILP